ncbi:S1/P1 nuclease [Pedosphaera parvula]|nr:S1/P1 nuclease [Pedosphaera parvula]
MRQKAARKHFPAGMLLRLVACFWLCCGFPNCAGAWDAEGHMVVAQIGYNHLDPAVKAKCDALISVALTNVSSQNNTFVTAACWADDNKAALGTAIWHYIDLPFSLDGTPTNGVAPASTNVVFAIRQCVATLQSTNATQIDQAISLRYLIHFVGDIQQPLHASTAVSASSPGGDAGGNSFSLSGYWNNLHSLWDAGGGYLTNSISRPLTAGGQSIIDGKVSAIEVAYPFTSNIGVIPNPMDWANESWGLAQNVAYAGLTRSSTPSVGYLTTVQNTTQQRMSQGGHRLANLLNTIYSTSPFSLSLLSHANGNFSFTWSAIQGRTYRVQWKSQLDGAGWNNLADIVAATNSVSFTNTVTQTGRFYRVMAVE